MTYWGDGTRTRNLQVSPYDRNFNLLEAPTCPKLQPVLKQFVALNPIELRPMRNMGFEPILPAWKAGVLTIDTSSAMRIPRVELGFPAWQAGVLPLHHIRIMELMGLEPTASWLQTKYSTIELQPHGEDGTCTRDLPIFSRMLSY